MRLFYKYATKIQLQPVYASAKLKERYVLVQPGPSELYRGILKDEVVKPSPMPAMWFPEPIDKSAKNRTVVIHFQGGAFVTAADPQQTGQLPSSLFAKKMNATTFYAQYRLSRNNETRFPAAVQDAVSFYRYVLDLGVDPKDIIISGDSAGGSVVLGLLRYIESSGEEVGLPSPRGVMAWSPWVDVTDAALARHQKNPHLQSDFLNLQLLQWGKEAYEPSQPSDESERYLAPVEHPFESKTPLFIHVGTKELLYDEVKLFAERMKGIASNHVCYHETKDANHDIILTAVLMGLVQEAEKAIQEAHDFFGPSGN
jgi:acetyl esterase/lipase